MPLVRESFKWKTAMEVDHIIPRSKGGLDRIRQFTVITQTMSHEENCKGSSRSCPENFAGAG